MKTLTILTLNFLPIATTPVVDDYQPNEVVTCFKTGEETAGMNKICYYDCLGNRAAITIKATQLCPLSINR